MDEIGISLNASPHGATEAVRLIATSRGIRHDRLPSSTSEAAQNRVGRGLLAGLANYRHAIAKIRSIGFDQDRQSILFHRSPRFRLSGPQHMQRIRITDEYSLVKRDGSARWYLEWRERGQKVRRASGALSLEQARERARELILAGVEIRNAAPDAIGLMVVLDRYRLKRGDKLPSKSTINRAVDIWREYWVESTTVADLTIDRQEAFVEWLREKGHSDGYLRRIVGVGQTALNRAKKRQEVTGVPFVDLPQGGEPFPHRADRAQLVALLNTPMPAHVWTYCLIRLNTSCRGDAALDLQPFQVDFDTKLVKLNPAGRKQTKKRRPVVPLTQMLEAHLKALPGPHYAGWQGRRTKSIRTTWRKIRTKAKLPAWFAPKVLRHTVASELRRRGVPEWDVSGLMGHTSGSQTGDYAKFDGAKGKRALDAWMRDLARDVPRLRGSVRGQSRKRLEMLGPLKPAPLLGFEWWAVQGSNL